MFALHYYECQFKEEWENTQGSSPASLLHHCGFNFICICLVILLHFWVAAQEPAIIDRQTCLPSYLNRFLPSFHDPLLHSFVLLSRQESAVSFEYGFLRVVGLFCSGFLISSLRRIDWPFHIYLLCDRHTCIRILVVAVTSGLWASWVGCVGCILTTAWHWRDCASSGFSFTVLRKQL